MMELALNNGQQKNALELAQLATEELKALLSPFLGGQWQNNTPTLRIPYYRPLDALRPGFYLAAPNNILPGKFFRTDALRRAQ
jgi:MarR-like DNA-binding transcriptional regulator SgrR of sgrS sRNA